jgi:hopanoid biosynthesis associated radical SAM protein HpnJ
MNNRKKFTAMEKRIFFINPPSFEGFDGGAGSRYAAKREIRSFWYPVWLAQATALCPDSRMVDAPAANKTMEETVSMGKDFDAAVIYTSTPGFANDMTLARSFKQQNPDMLVGMVGPHVTALPDDALAGGNCVDFVARGEFDYTVYEIARGKPYGDLDGISYKNGGKIVHNPDRLPIENLDVLPSVLDVYRRDLPIDNYYVGYLLHPYLAIHTGRGCYGRCTFCLWPQTIAGRKYRTRSPQVVIDEITRARDMFPGVKEFFFDDDTFTGKIGRAEEIARGLAPLNITWSCSARVDVPEKTLGVMRQAGMRLVMVGLESGSDDILKNVKKGITTEQSRKFVRACKKLDIAVHANFVLGLPGETRETIRRTIAFAKELDPDTLQVSIATPFPGTEFYRQAVENHWLLDSQVVTASGFQQAAHEFQNLSSKEMFDAVETLYRGFYFRPKPILRMLRTMVADREVCMRRLREGWEFFGYMHKRKRESQ